MNFFQVEQEQTVPIRVKKPLRNTTYAVAQRRKKIVKFCTSRPRRASELSGLLGYSTMTGSWPLLQTMVREGALVKHGDYYMTPNGPITPAPGRAKDYSGRKSEPRRQAILKMLAEKGPMRLSDISRAQGYSTHTAAWNLLQGMIDDGLLVKEAELYHLVNGVTVSTEAQAAATAPKEVEASKPKTDFVQQVLETALEYVLETGDNSLRGFLHYLRRG